MSAFLIFIQENAKISFTFFVSCDKAIHPSKRNDAQVILSILCAVPSNLFVNTPLLYGKVPKLLTEVANVLLLPPNE